MELADLDPRRFFFVHQRVSNGGHAIFQRKQEQQTVGGFFRGTPIPGLRQHGSAVIAWHSSGWAEMSAKSAHSYCGEAG